jgi:hypothetical protein
MRKTAVGLTAGLVLGLIFGAMAVPATSQGPNERTTLTVFDPNKTEYSKDIDEGRKGFSPGDWNVSVEKVLDPETCERAGKAIIRFTFVRSIGRNDGNFIVDFTYQRPDGKLTAYSAGRFKQFEGGFAFPVTGGSGAYKDAGGEVTLEENVEHCDKKGALLTFDLAL